MRAVILAGGKGTRLGHLAKDIPKPMVRIGDKPILEHLVLNLKRYGIEDITLITGHLSHIIEKYFGDGRQWGIRIDYFVEKTPMGTTGGIKLIADRLKEDFLVLYGDVMLDVNFKRLIEFHRTHGGAATLAVHPNDHPYDSDLLEADDEGRVVRFHPKPHLGDSDLPNLVNAALYVLAPRVLDSIPKDRAADFGKDIFPTLVQRDRIFIYRTNEYLKDAGTPDRLEKVNADFLSGKIARMNSENPRRAVFLDRDGVLNEDHAWIKDPDQIHLLSGTSGAIRALNHSEYLGIVVTNQPVVARGDCSLEDLTRIHYRLETLLGKDRAWLDAIYFCPHHPDRGFPGENPKYKIDCDCRKPKPGMILQASQEMGIDLRRSFLVGDSFRDIECGRSAGVATLGVRTGKGCLDGPCDPDYIFDDLSDAVSFILDPAYASTFETCWKSFQQSPKRPFVVSIGGNSRSGKSTLARYLQKAFGNERQAVTIVSLDQWILPTDERKQARSVHDRYRLPEMTASLRELLSGKPINLEPYNSMTRDKGTKREIRLRGEPVVILEGIVALSTPELLGLSDLRIFREVDLKHLKKRFLRYCDWRGISAEEAERLFEARRDDEYHRIEQEKKHGDWIL